MVLVAEQFEHIVGIDTHARTHTYCVIHSRTGAVIDTAAFPTSAAGHKRALNWLSCRFRGSFPAREGGAGTSEAEEGQRDQWCG